MLNHTLPPSLPPSLCLALSLSLFSLSHSLFLSSRARALSLSTALSLRTRQGGDERRETRRGREILEPRHQMRTSDSPGTYSEILIDLRIR